MAKMFRTATFCIFLLVLEKTTCSMIIQREQNHKMTSKNVPYEKMNSNDDNNIKVSTEEMNLEYLDNLPRINEERLLQDVLYVDTTAKKQLKDKKIMKNNDELRNDSNDGSEDYEESSNENKENNELDESDEDYSDGVINSNNYFTYVSSFTILISL
uniref:Uncharacterized protein n=1 Tax=Onchocerca volvulus TaxID=6282 RepID=A0A8R1XNS0_ONCVO